MKYLIQDELLFKGSQLCVPKCLMRDNLLKEKHNGGLDGHFGHDKTYAQLSSSYYWPGMRSDVKKIMDRCKIYQYEKGKKLNTGLYQPFPIPDRSWDIICMDFFFGIAKNLEGK
jgi:hypothetical protein